VISQGPFAYAEVNVRAQDGVDGSLLEHVRRLIRLRRSCPAIGWGAWQVLECGATELLALSTSWQGDRIVTLHNLADAEVEASLPDDVQGQRLELLLGSSAEPADAPRAGTLRLEPFGYRWFRCAGER
jgi:maltose alpha-D-glucosyltransferase / alpha-amylase